MKIAFIGWKDTEVNIFKELGVSLSKRISGLELEERFVPFLEDIPAVADECAKDSDFIFVFALIEDIEDARFIKQKLIDVEIANKTRILKALTDDTISGMDEADYIEARDAMVQEYSDLIVNILFNEREFEPKEKDFGL
jgi:hypothetical protein